MKKCFIFLIVAVYSVVSFAQKNIDGLINAEKRFAAYSVAHGTKDAFVNFLDSSEGMMFEQGKPVKAIDYWNKREKRPGVLNWHPQFAGIASSGDFGFTTGPWTFQASTNDTVAARGQYTTVWHVDKNGQWKFLVDLGVQNTPENTDTELHRMDNAEDPTVYRGSLDEMLKAENDFIKNTSTMAHKGNDRRVWFSRSISTNWGDGVLNRNGQLPADESDKWQDVLHAMPPQIKYTINGSGIAISMDMGYVYGTTEINGKTENYLRIWRKEKTGWKVAVEVLRY